MCIIPASDERSSRWPRFLKGGTGFSFLLGKSVSSSTDSISITPWIVSRIAQTMTVTTGISG